VNRFKTKFREAWIDRRASELREHRRADATYPIYPIDSAMNFPPAQDYATRASGATTRSA